MLRRPLSLALLALLAAEMPDAAQAFAPSSLRAFGAAKAQLPARTCAVRSGLTSVKMGAAVWKEVQDPGSGDIYYWNVQTGETSWEKPAPAAPAAPARGDASKYEGAGLPTSSVDPLIPGANVFGDAMWFGEGFIKNDDFAAGSEYDNWGKPLPTASEATKAAWAAAKQEAKLKEISNKSTFPYDIDKVLPK
jgi:hypothetical protein